MYQPGFEDAMAKALFSPKLFVVVHDTVFQTPSTVGMQLFFPLFCGLACPFAYKGLHIKEMGVGYARLTKQRRPFPPGLSHLMQMTIGQLPSLEQMWDKKILNI